MTLAIILYTPDIPQNTGNIIRLAANTGCELHLIKPLGWGEFNNSKLRRAGLDYHEWAKIMVHQTWYNCALYFKNRKIWAVETNGTKFYTQISYKSDDVFLFGSEVRGLTPEILSSLSLDNTIRLPMKINSRSLNLANSVAIVVYEAWRQLNFTGGI